MGGSATAAKCSQSCSNHVDSEHDVMRRFIRRHILSHIVHNYIPTDSAVGAATGWTSEGLLFDSRQEQEMYFFSKMSRTALGPTQPPIQWAM